MRNRLTGKIRRFLFNRHGTNPIISSVMLASAVITLGFVVFAYAQQRAAESNIQYFDNTNQNIAKIQEKLTFEHIHNNNSVNELSVFLINCGKSNEITVTRVYLTNDSWAQSFDTVELKSLNGTVTQSLDALEEGFFQLSINLVEDTSYSIQVVTARGREFVTTFVA